MKKKLWGILLISAVLFLLILTVPIPTGVMKDGGSREFTALTYKIVRWNRMILVDGDPFVYDHLRVYPFPQNLLDIDGLWGLEVERNPSLSGDFSVDPGFYATVTEIRDNGFLVDGLDTNEINFRYEFSFSVNENTVLERDGRPVPLSAFQVGDTVFIEYTGEVMECYPARITVTRLTLIPPGYEEESFGKSVPYTAEMIRVDGSGDSAGVFQSFAEPKAETDAERPLDVIAVESKEELLQILDGLKQSEAYRSGSLWPQSELYQAYPQRYDGTFFSENTLLLIYVGEPSSSYSHRIYSCSVKDGVCTVAVETVVPETGDCAMAGWIIALSVAKKDLQNVSFSAYRTAP